MKKEFLAYKLEQLLDEKSFVEWVLHKQKNREWEKFIEENPDFRNKVNQARKIILLLRDKYETLDEKSVMELWKKISYFEKQQSEKRRKLTIHRWVSRAAVLLLLVSLGTFGYFYFTDQDAGYQFKTSSETTGDEARMVLSTGEEIALKKDNSTIALNDSANQVIVNDSIFDLAQKSEAGNEEFVMNEVIIPYGKKSELLLADGTKVWVNAGSRLAFPSKFTKSTREVYLEGEACFEVTRNDNQPFIVKTGNINVKVLGTHFNISAYPTDETIETILLKGSVAVERPGSLGRRKNEIILKPNQKASFVKGEEKLSVSEESDADFYIAWTYGWLKYNKESLLSVLRKVERYYNISIQLPSNYPGDDLITGKLDLKESLEEVMLALADASGFEYRIIEGKVIIEKKNSSIKTTIKK
ncbi:MAG: FecR domain-containing protein [Mariniphaga sp.]|nr:FecR domain-containing protein [Mariniphaga sp.]